MEKFKVIVKKTRNILGWRLKIVDNKTVEIKVGLLADWKKIIKEKEDWIVKRLAKMPERKKIIGLKKLNILGEEYKLNIAPGRNDSLIFFDDKKEIYVRSKRLTESCLQKLIDKKMRPPALKIIREKAKELGEKFGIKLGGIKIKNQKTRFGSCSSRGNLNFNWQIIIF
ncbi:MAG: YgjP-like metallopeptidase domain-containing protein, partial [Patescibacteria group bacterium]